MAKNTNTEQAVAPSNWAFAFDGTPQNLANDVVKANIPEEVKTFILGNNIGKRTVVHSFSENPIIEPSESSGPAIPRQIISIVISNY